MKLRKLLDWRKLLIYSHRWLGIGIMLIFAPEYASSMTYDALLESPDELTRIPTLAGYVPLHRLAMNDPAGTEYYISAKSNDIVQKTDRKGRILA